ncbi:hypothetical protein GCM10022252_73690 [Streptosporangium oxazolinicum]|uniref:Uncharacterized protein n=1 Tax=Streptosporangium oxazolinicum TaxID=909287 RepID=A0ABP8BJS9_9ACTN
MPPAGESRYRRAVARADSAERRSRLTQRAATMLGTTNPRSVAAAMPRLTDTPLDDRLDAFAERGLRLQRGAGGGLREVRHREGWRRLADRDDHLRARDGVADPQPPEADAHGWR